MNETYSYFNEIKFSMLYFTPYRDGFDGSQFVAGGSGFDDVGDGLKNYILEC